MYSAVEDFEKRYVRPREGHTLIAGSRVYEGRADRRLRYKHVVGWDLVEGLGVDHVVDLERVNPDTCDPVFDHIDCISVLEHARRPWLVAQNIELLLRPKGTLFLEVPFIWRVHNYPDDYWRFSIAGVRALFQNIVWHKMMYAHVTLTDEGEKISATRVDGYLYCARTEVCAFGSRA